LRRAGFARRRIFENSFQNIASGKKKNPWEKFEKKFFKENLREIFPSKILLKKYYRNENFHATFSAAFEYK
jgi:hypothetical protein